MAKLMPEIEDLSRSTIVQLAPYVPINEFQEAVTALTLYLRDATSTFLAELVQKSSREDADFLVSGGYSPIRVDTYVTVNPATVTDQYNVVVMKFSPTLDEYVVHKMSRMLAATPANHLAQAWAKAGGWELR